MFHFDWGVFWPLVIVGGVLGWLILEKINALERDLKRDLQQICIDLHETRILLHNVLLRIKDNSEGPL